MQVAYIEIFTDGSSKGNPGRGGYGVVLKYRNFRKELSQGYRKTTNNRMELLAVIVGLEELKTGEIPIKIYSDSKYVVDSISKGWVFNWVKTNFKGKKNRDLWERFLALYPKYHIEMVWVKGHNGHPENECCDRLAVAASDQGNNLIDEGFEKTEFDD